MSARPDRDYRTAYAMRLAGFTYNQIAGLFDVSRERARQIAARGERDNKHREAIRRLVGSPSRGRVIDMGGYRGWQEWTPESNARELGLCR